VLVDCGDAVVHILQPQLRLYYNLEEIWGDKPVRVKLAAGKGLAKASEPMDDEDAEPAPRVRRASNLRPALARLPEGMKEPSPPMGHEDTDPDAIATIRKPTRKTSSTGTGQGTGTQDHNGSQDDDRHGRQDAGPQVGNRHRHQNDGSQDHRDQDCCCQDRRTAQARNAFGLTLPDVPTTGHLSCNLLSWLSATRCPRGSKPVSTSTPSGCRPSCASSFARSSRKPVHRAITPPR
jgi:hypothetical protein